jgi:hypothetical protein
MSSLTKRYLVWYPYMHTLKTSVRCHSIALTKIGVEIGLEKLILSLLVDALGAPDGPVCTRGSGVHRTADPESMVHAPI